MSKQWCARALIRCLPPIQPPWRFRDPTRRGFSACVKGMVVGPMNPEPQPITLLVMIEHGKFADRHRATSQDGCATETYEKVEAAR